MRIVKSGHVGRTDRMLRLAVAVILIGFALICPFAAGLGPVVQLGSGAVGLILGATAIVGWCPIYRLIGVKT
ncbi:MAG: YgaP family membrane protein [Rubricella sp.]